MVARSASSSRTRIRAIETSRLDFLTQVHLNSSARLPAVCNPAGERLQLQSVQLLDGQGPKEVDPAGDFIPHSGEGSSASIFTSFHRRRVRAYPMRDHRLAGPDQTPFNGLLPERHHE